MSWVVKPAHWISLAALLAALQGASLKVLNDVEHRLTRLETLAEARK